MNANTKEKLKNFVLAVETLTIGVVSHIGISNAAEILTACHELKIALNKDETLIDIS